MKKEDQIIDSSLLEACLRYDRTACRRLYEYLKMPLFKVCRRYTSTHEEAEDVLQEGFLKIFRDLKQFDSKHGTISQWSARVMINTALENIRKKNRRPQLSEVDDAIYQIQDQSDVLEALKINDILAYLNKLPDGYKLVFNLYVVDGFNHKEIAEKLNISESTSKSQLFKARKKLIELLTSSKELVYQNA